jgi:uncharacterized protein
MGCVTRDRGAALVKVRLTPRGGRDEIGGERAGALLVRVAAPPVDGRANDALCRLLARSAGVPKARVEVIRGATRREKTVRIEGVEADELACRLRS